MKRTRQSIIVCLTAIRALSPLSLPLALVLCPPDGSLYLAQFGRLYIRSGHALQSAVAL